MSSGRPSLSTVIVSCGLEPLLRACLALLAPARATLGAGAADRTVVIDNASPVPYGEALAREFGVEIRREAAPIGFARACNLGAAATPGDLLLLLNNDVLLQRASLGAMVEVIRRDPEIGIVGLRLLFPDGTLQHAGVVFGPDRVGPYHLGRRGPPEAVARRQRDFQAVTGACMLVRRTLWEELGGMDEGYAFGLEDIDLCLRARRRGWRVACCQAGEALHFESMTPGRVEKDKPSRKRFMKRWKGRYEIDG